MMKVAIIGGGIIGCSISYFLKKLNPDVDVTIFDGQGVATQATSVAAGFLSENSEGRKENDLVEWLSASSFSMFKELSVELGKDIGFRPLKTYFLELDLSNKKGAKPTSKSGALSWMNQGDHAKLIGDLDTAQVHPVRLALAFLEHAKRKGAKFIKKSVTGVEFDQDSKVKGIHLEDGEVFKTDTVILANGVWADLCRDWFPKASQVFGTFAHRGHTITHKANLPPEATFVDLHTETPWTENVSIYPQPNGTTITAGCYQYKGTLSKPGFVKPDHDSFELLQEWSGKISPVLAQSEVTSTKVGYMHMSSDSTPLMGPIPGYPGAYMAVGHGWWGVNHSPITGKMMASLILCPEKESEDLKPYYPDRFFDTSKERLEKYHGIATSWES